MTDRDLRLCVCVCGVYLCSSGSGSRCVCISKVHGIQGRHCPHAKPFIGGGIHSSRRTALLTQIPKHYLGTR